MEKFYTFMRGRYGADGLSAGMILAAFVTLILVMLLDVWWLFFLPILLSVLACYRILSRAIDARRAEMELVRSTWERVRFFFVRLRERKHYVFVKCRHCGVYLRLPKGKGRMSVTCPKCKSVHRMRT